MTRKLSLFLLICLIVQPIYGAGITDAVPEVDPSYYTESNVEGTIIEHTGEERVNLFADAEKVMPLPETPTPTPEIESLPEDVVEAPKQTVPRQEEGIRGTILRIRTGYQFEDGSFDEWITGAGFLIGKDCILTTKPVAIVSQDSSLYQSIYAAKKNGYKQLGIDLSDFSTVKKSLKTYAIADEGEILCDAIDFEKADSFAVLKLEHRVNAYGTAVFASEAAQSDAKVYATDTKVTDSTYAILSADVYIREATISGERKSGTSNYIEFDGDFSGLTAGCPLVDENENVVGLITDGTAGRGSAVLFESIQKVLDAENIEYSYAGEESGKKVVSELNALIENAGQVDRTLYTQDSLSAYDLAVKNGADLLKEESPSNNRIAKAIEEINTAEKGLTVIDRSAEKRRNQIKVAVFVIILFAIAFGMTQIKKIGKDPIDLEMEKEERKEQKQIKKEEKRIQKEERRAKKAEQTEKKKPKEKKQKEKKPTEKSVTVKEENTQRNNGAGETTVLTQEQIPAGYLYRKATKEEITILGTEFLIGKHESADCQITGNDTISREHCVISKVDGLVYVEDLGSTNGTKINGKPIEKHKKILLPDGARLELSNEVFEVHLSGEES